MIYRQLFAILFLLLVACKGEKPSSTTLTVDSVYTGPLLAFQNIETVYSQMGDAKLVLRAPLQYREQSGDERFPAGVEMDVYDDLGRKKTLLLADSARYLSSQRLYVMMGNVSVTNLAEQQKLETPVLFWDERYREIYTDTTVRITTAKEILKGKGLRARQDFSQYKILVPTGVLSADQ